MRSHSSRSSHRSSMSRSHRSMHSSLHRSSLSKRMHKSAFKKHGISNAHAFAVGKATGVNINASAMGAHGAALHRMKRMREQIASHRHSNMFNKSYASRHRSDFINKMHVSHRKGRFTSNKYDFSYTNLGEEFNNAINETSKYIWIPILIFAIMFIGFIGTIVFITSMSLGFFK